MVVNRKNPASLIMNFRNVLRFLAVLCLSNLLVSCDTNRVYEDYVEFPQRMWVVREEPVFAFVIADSTQTYNLYYNVRNSIQYDWDRIFVSYSLLDSAGGELSRKLVYNNLFDPTGRPLGESGLGDLYDHQFPLLQAYRFPKAGTYRVRLTQFSRQDSLRGVLAVGIRVERATPGE